MKAKVSFVLVLAFVFSLVGVGFQPAQAAEPVQVAEIEPLQAPVGCYRQGVVYWTPDVGITEYSMLHKKHNEKPVPGCGAVLKTSAGVWHEYYELGEKCWPDACIKNYVIKGLNGQHDRYWTIVRALGDHVLTRLALWNQ